MCDVFGEYVKNKLLDIVEDSAAFFDGGQNGREVVVRQDYVGRVLIAALIT